MIGAIDILILIVIVAAFSRMLAADSLRNWPKSRWVLATMLVWAVVSTFIHRIELTSSSPDVRTLETSFDLLFPVMFLFFLQMMLNERSRRRLAESDQTYRLIVDNAEELIYQMDLKGHLLFANNSALKVSGYTWPKVKGISFADILHPDDVRLVRRITVQRVLRGKRVRYNVRLRTKNGEIRHLDAMVVPILRDGKVVASQGIARDVTNERRALSQAQFLASVITDSQAPILIFDEDGKILVWNRGMETLTGTARSLSVGRPYDALIPDTPDLMLETAAHGGVFTVELQIPTASSKIPVLLNVYRIDVSEPHTAHAVFFQDLTHQRRLEEQLLHHQRMEALGKLAGGIAHDFNNILTIISGNAMILKNQEALTEDLKPFVDAIVRSTKRGANLTGQLLTFSRRQPFLPKRLNVEELIDETVDLLSHAGWSSIEFDSRIEPGLPPIWADSGRIQQVLMNLCVNARDAMPDGGTITFQAERKEYLSDSQMPRGTAATPGNYVRISVCDEGVGMDQETIDRIFEPFFTTKSPSKGTGLGLANVHGIVQQHSGWVEVESEIGKGTKFHVLLPTADTYSMTSDDSISQNLLDEWGEFPFDKPALEELPEAVPEVVSKLLHGDETVLFVDDEALVRDMGRNALELYGYKVITAEDGPQALEVFDQRRPEIDLVVLDWSMREMPGQNVLQQLRARDVEIPILMHSGVWPPSQKGILIAQGANGFLAKPYVPEALVAEVRRLLDHRKTNTGGEGKKKAKAE